jgi:hypothetical protein
MEPREARSDLDSNLLLIEKLLGSLPSLFPWKFNLVSRGPKYPVILGDIHYIREAFRGSRVVPADTVSFLCRMIKLLNNILL